MSTSPQRSCIPDFLTAETSRHFVHDRKTETIFMREKKKEPYSSLTIFSSEEERIIPLKTMRVAYC